jgi:hypothetical protein
MSPPVQKALPAPVSTTTFTFGSVSQRSRISPQRLIMSLVNALYFSGRLSVIVATPCSSVSNRISDSAVIGLSPVF